MCNHAGGHAPAAVRAQETLHWRAEMVAELSGLEAAKTPITVGHRVAGASGEEDRPLLGLEHLRPEGAPANEGSQAGGPTDADSGSRNDGELIAKRSEGDRSADRLPWISWSAAFLPARLEARYLRQGFVRPLGRALSYGVRFHSAISSPSVASGAPWSSPRSMRSGWPLRHRCPLPVSPLTLREPAGNG